MFACREIDKGAQVNFEIYFQENFNLMSLATTNLLIVFKGDTLEEA